LEALNNIGYTNSRFIVVLNDNKMSISRNVGSMSEHLKKIRLSRGYYKFKYRAEIIIRKTPLIGKCMFKLLSRIKRVLTRQVFKNNLFESFGFKYIGPVDGHDVEQLETALEIAKLQNQPCVLHTVTKKGKGYVFAEEQPGSYHGVSAFDTHDGLVMSGSENFSSVCGKTLCNLAEKDSRICAITAAMTTGTGLEDFSQKFPERFFDVGIAEEYAATFASGLAAGGMLPYFAVYSSFLQRTYDQIIHDTAIAKLPVRFLIDRAGIVGDDGETHQGVFDVAFMTTVPGMTIYSPASYNELEGIINSTVDFNAPVAIRYPRGKEVYPFAFDGQDYTVFSNNANIAIVTYGIISAEAIKAMQELKEKGINVDVIKLNKIYPVSNELVELTKNYSKVYFFEEGMLRGSISEHIVAKAKLTNYSINAIENTFVSAAEASKSRAKYSLDSKSMFNIIAGEN
ncbi:MAG: 1-deoxy-D-xylulose-5-phosphate synthase, partial [Clostridia bacterium]|nr:1-deoxy-D-xylulose-5-phosphate synthase [Clostridia bacterium]